MIKIAVLSDTHGNLLDIDKLQGILLESDFVFHLGDHYDDMRNLYPQIKHKLYRVHGNCDWGTNKELIVPVGEHNFFVTHGDLYGAKRGTEKLVDKAIEEGCSVVLYGHTHIAEIKKERGVLLINPGTMSKYAPKKSFCYIVVNGDKITPVINDKIFN
ncbi:MAG: metallophosphoesterase [Clostridiales bacterium]|nr:metallophosphoesterase [Clostridiales bacterium]